MKKIKRKSEVCLNCGQTFDKSVNYCPNCGQQNTDNYVSLKTLLGEFFNNYFSFDSRFARTFYPFLFKPGKVTKTFLEGKRLLYANPIRWYLVISLFHFLILNQFQSIDVSSDKAQESVINIGSRDKPYSVSEIDSLKLLPDSIKYNFDDDEFEISDYEFAVMKSMALSDTFSSNEIYDSLMIDQKPIFTKIIATTVIKSMNSTSGAINSYLLDKVPVIMFFILPLYGFLLKGFYFKKGYYIKHLIHSIHIHAFLFLLLGIGWLISWLIIDISELAAFVSFSLTFIYILFSSRRLYQQTYWLLTLKTIGIGFFYLVLMVITFLLGMLISILLM